MKSLILAVLAASVFAGSISAQAAVRHHDNFDGYKFFNDIANRGS